MAEDRLPDGARPPAAERRPVMEQSKIDNYVSARGAAAYRSDYHTKLHRKVSDRWERALFARLFELIGRSETLLDLPCGAGRLYGLFAEHAERVVEADFSPSMLALNASDHDCAAHGYVRCSGLAIPFADRSFDTVVSVRLNHHLGSAADRERHLLELMRVARRAVVVSYFSHNSLKNLLRRLRAPFDGKGPKKTLRTARVEQLAAEAGFAVRRRVPLSRIGSGHVFALLVRV